MPSALILRESVIFNCPPRVVYQYLENPKRWISRSDYFVRNQHRLVIDSTNIKQPTIYRWSSKNGDKGWLQLKESKRYENLTFSISYHPFSEGEIVFNLINQREKTQVNASVYIDLPNSIWLKFKVYISYYFIRKDFRRDLQSAVMDCNLNNSTVIYEVKSGAISDFRAFIRKKYVSKKDGQGIMQELLNLQKVVPPKNVAGLPYIQFSTSPIDDTLKVITGFPVKNGEIQRIPNAILALFTGSKTLYARYRIGENIEDIYNQLIYEANKQGLLADGYPIIFLDLKKQKATMHLPVTK